MLDRKKTDNNSLFFSFFFFFFFLGGGGGIYISTSLLFELSMLRNKISNPYDFEFTRFDWF